MATRLDTARRRLGQEINGLAVFTATANGSTSTIVCTTAFQSTELPQDALAYAWIYVPQATVPKQRRVAQAGLNPTTATITLEAAMGSNLVINVVFEVLTKLPAVAQTSDTVGAGTSIGLHECLNQALDHMLIPDDAVTLPLVNNQRDYSLSVGTYPYLDRPSRLREVRVLDALGTTYVPTSHRWEVREGGRGATLRFNEPFRFSSGSYSAYLDVLRPAGTLINVNSAGWADSSVGAVNEADLAPVDIRDWVAVAKPFAYQALRNRSRGEARAQYEDLYTAALQDARKVRSYDRDNDIDPSVPAAAPTAQAA